MNPRDTKKFKEIKRRLADMQQSHADDIERGAFLRISASVVSEAQWLVKLVEKLQSGQAEVDEDAEALEIVTA